MPKAPSNQMKGGVLNLASAIPDEFAASILALIRRMCEETKRELGKTLDGHALDSYAMDSVDADKSGNASSQSRIAINQLLGKYEPLFARWGKKAVKRMTARTLRNSNVTLGLSLRELSDKVTLNPGAISDRMAEMITAASTEATALIKLIPTKYLTEVQGAVSRSIASGAGLKDLNPFLEQKYAQNIRHARLVALDQTRKTYSNLTGQRMREIGVKSFEWIHTSGSQTPRPDHIELSGKVFSLDDLPVIGVMYGQEVRGKPGDMPNCRCRMRPLVSFD